MPLSNRFVADAVDLLVSFAIPLSGFWHHDPAVYFSSYLWVFLPLVTTILFLASVAYILSLHCGRRIQGDRKKQPLFAAEIWGSVRCIFLVSGMAAWPVGNARCGLDHGFAWTLNEIGLPLELACLQVLCGIILMDAWTYWKHRLLHTKLLYHFHRYHHKFHDPTAFGSFAVGPVETVLTFWPIWTMCFPGVKRFAPLYTMAVSSFVMLNFYLHCGVTVAWLEAVLPKLALNSSAWHNVHHSHVRAHYGEISYVWDVLCRTQAKSIN